MLVEDVLDQFSCSQGNRAETTFGNNLSGYFKIWMKTFNKNLTSAELLYI
jgi:hypothetical protein